MARALARLLGLAAIAAAASAASHEQQPRADDLAEAFLVGLGKADMTGPIAEVNQMGYANPSQLAAGIHTRLFARAFIVADPAKPETRICFVSMDAGMPSQAQKIALVRKLRAKFGDRYTERNVLISGTHTHSGPSGFFQYMLFDLAGSLFVNQTFTAFVDGVYDAIVAADAHVQPGSITAAQGGVDGGNINRSPSSYLYNPASERSRYPSDTDHGLVQLNFRYAGDSEAGSGLFNWFAAHPTSMNFTNHLISSDHKGTASQYIEQAADPGALTGQEKFVAAFASMSRQTPLARCATVGRTRAAPVPSTAPPAGWKMGRPRPRTAGLWAPAATCSSRRRSSRASNRIWLPGFASLQWLPRQRCLAQSALPTPSSTCPTTRCQEA